jgi:hypothetical protein
MSTGLDVDISTIVSAFYNELLRQGLVVAVILLLVGAAWSVGRTAQLRRAVLGQTGQGAGVPFSGPRLGRWILAAMGAFWVGTAVLQAWPGRGFWQGHATRGPTPGTLTSMLRGMAATLQPHLLSSWVSAFAGFDAAHGWAVIGACPL